MRLVIDTENKVRSLGDLFGIFFEDINHAADGGLYAELVRNRSFECCPVDNPGYSGLTAWKPAGDIERLRLDIGEVDPAFAENPHYLVMEYTGSGEKAGVQNRGFNTGIAVEEGKKYCFTCHARGGSGHEEIMSVVLCSAAGQVYAERDVALQDTWQKYEWILEAPVTDPCARLALMMKKAGCIHVAFVSLFPVDTFRGRRNGMRKDLAELLEAMHPKFMRFPGGCLVHTGSLNRKDRDSLYRWKDTLGAVEHRPARKNRWGYHQTMGLGYYEYFQFCEDIGAKPLPVIPAGYDPHHYFVADGELLEEYVQDALDLVEFANGGADTHWGKLRFELGHPSPFGMEYLGIGNEEEGEAFYERYRVIHRALREHCPEIRLIGTSGPFAAGYWYDRGWEEACREGADLVDEHYYMAPQWFISNSRRYDHFAEKPPYVFVGEYASKGNRWYNALAEACFMTGLQNASHAVKLACYAPLFCNVDYQDWKPDLIWYDNHQAVVTPNYHVQKLFMEHQGDWLLSQEMEDMPEAVITSVGQDSLAGGIGLEAEHAKVRYRNIVIVDDHTGETLYHVDEICLDRARSDPQIPFYVDTADYTISMEAERISGGGGFAVYFAACGDNSAKNAGNVAKNNINIAKKSINSARNNINAEKNNINAVYSSREIFWRLGGSSNKDSTLIEVICGQTAVMTYQTRHIEDNRVYRLEIRVRGTHIETLVDGVCEQTAVWKPVCMEALYASSSKDEKSGDIIVKLVNVLPVNQKLEIVLNGNENESDAPTRWEGAVWILAGSGDVDARGLERIVPESKPVSIDGSTFAWEIAAETLHILRLGKK